MLRYTVPLLLTKNDDSKIKVKLPPRQTLTRATGYATPLAPPPFPPDLWCDETSDEECGGMMSDCRVR